MFLEENLVAYAASGRSTCFDIVIGQLFVCIGAQASFLRDEPVISSSGISIARLMPLSPRWTVSVYSF